MAEEGNTLIVADYAQIELKVAAHLSKDATLIEAFKSGADIHSATAKNVFRLDCDVDEIKNKYPVYRQVAKAINFGIIYEAGPKTLAATANKGIKNTEDHVDEAFMEDVIQKYFLQYPGIKKYIELCHQRAIKYGHIQTITGRKRYLPDAQLECRRDTDKIRRMYGALRQSSNSPVQGGAADVLAIAMRNIRRRLKKEGLSDKAKFVLQVHDEVVTEVKEEFAETVANIVKEEMENAVSLKVPLIADVQIGKIWGDLK